MEHQGFAWSLTNLVYYGSSVITHWPSPSLEQPQCTQVLLPSQLHVCDHALPSGSFSCSTLWDRTREQDGLMAHHFYYGYLLLPCCVGKTDVERFRIQTPSKPCKAACGSLSQQHPPLCLDVEEESSPAVYWHIAHSSASWTHGSTCALSP